MSENEYELCAKLDNIPELGWMPLSGYFGVTAATGGLSDDHDVLSFVTHSLVPLEERKEEVIDLTVYWRTRYNVTVLLDGILNVLLSFERE